MLNPVHPSRVGRSFSPGRSARAGEERSRRQPSRRRARIYANHRDEPGCDGSRLCDWNNMADAFVSRVLNSRVFGWTAIAGPRLHGLGDIDLDGMDELGVSQATGLGVQE
jgi:hypothetical protein